ncbi:hypothetical protein V474_02595 [Novosphingobium barchaimii LL02]|uniref:HTH tetR-type domain-containing protein n=1 Tax=Novosphingobium barchaimii LL02 TaxID=1114963 RepID=A0A0J7XJX4_9SPHN|nr:TetR family transcriptional regulator [Novosphingobium barchaimii]KMS51954.1 hypothetical protein V474_02595 [Novosphingobium barchaimii LL02]
MYARGEETRSRILGAAMRLFATVGFDRVTTRAIAAEADVPAPSLRYYFTNKEGLYIACLEHIRGQLHEAMEPALDAAERLLARADAERMLLIDSFCALQEEYFDHMISRPDSATFSLFMARHDLAASAGGKRLPTGDGAPAYRMVKCFTQTIMRISNGSLDWQGALLVAGMVNGQMEPLVAKRRGLADVGIEIAGERMRWIKRTLRQQTIAALLLHCD